MRYTMHLGYVTNGFADHTLRDSLTILTELGYDSVAITLERWHLDPPDAGGVSACVNHLRSALASAPMRVTVETGSRFILDPRHKHQPSMISRRAEDCRRRIDFLLAAVDVAAGLGADVVSLWSGSPDEDASESELFDRLVASLEPVLRHAEQRDVRLAFEPEPGMFIDTMARFERLLQRIDHPSLGLSLDVGHVVCLGDGEVGGHIRRWRDRLWNIHIEDMRRGEHEHRMFGDGEVDFNAVFGALCEIAYAGPVHVELPRHSHDAVEVARMSMGYLSGLIGVE